MQGNYKKYADISKASNKKIVTQLDKDDAADAADLTTEDDDETQFSQEFTDNGGVDHTKETETTFSPDIVNGDETIKEAVDGGSESVDPLAINEGILFDFSPNPSFFYYFNFHCQILI